MAGTCSSDASSGRSICSECRAIALPSHCSSRCAVGARVWTASTMSENGIACGSCNGHVMASGNCLTAHCPYALPHCAAHHRTAPPRRAPPYCPTAPHHHRAAPPHPLPHPLPHCPTAPLTARPTRLPARLVEAIEQQQRGRGEREDKRWHHQLRGRGAAAVEARQVEPEAQQPLTQRARVEVWVDLGAEIPARRRAVLRNAARRRGASTGVTCPLHARCMPVTRPSHAVTCPSHAVTRPSCAVTRPSYAVTRPLHARYVPIRMHLDVGRVRLDGRRVGRRAHAALGEGGADDLEPHPLHRVGEGLQLLLE